MHVPYTWADKRSYIEDDVITTNGILMGIFGDIERLIDEHASPAILKERILLLRKKHAAFVSENIAHKTRIAELGTQVRQLKQEIAKLQEINEKLEFENSKLKNQANGSHI
ncbi:MAG: hypothetical protein DHS20C09_10210 [marine bacterium B5-7]|nr:MAG: hypothetical protein DHS20C09_10210 [marine bacterium B5-7]